MKANTYIKLELMIFAMTTALAFTSMGQTLPSGVVAYYPFNGSALDDSGNTNDLQATSGAAQYTDGLFGDALYLDGSTRMGTVSGAFPNGVPTGANPWTVACFIKADTNNFAYANWLTYGNNAAYSLNGFMVVNQSSIHQWWSGNDLDASLPSGSFQDGYHSWVTTWDGTTRTIYFDGAVQASQETTGPNIGTNEFVLGNGLAGADNAFTGWLDELLIADRAFSAAEVLAYHQYGGPGVPTGAPPTPGPLQITQSGNSVIISWPTIGSETLQQNTNLMTATWETTGYTITTNSGTNSITITSPAGNLFFRLSNP